jgi:hypothetical protein
MGNMTKIPTVLVALTEGKTPSNEQYSSEFRMDITHSLANNREFWHGQVDEFLDAAVAGPAKLVLSSDPGEVLKSTTTTPTQLSTQKPSQSQPVNRPQSQPPTYRPPGPRSGTQGQSNMVAITTPGSNGSNVIRSGAVKSEAFKILSGAPIPTPARGRRKQPVSDIYPFKDMPVGSMFTVTGKQNVQKARNAAQQWCKDQGPTWKFTTRDVSNTPNSEGGVYPPETYGIWRVVPQVAVVHAQQGTAEVTGDLDEAHHNSNAPEIDMPPEDDTDDELLRHEAQSL